MSKLEEQIHFTHSYATATLGRKTLYRTDLMSAEVPVITKDEIKKVLKVMSRGKAAGTDEITVDLWKDEGDTLPKKLANLYTKCLKASKVAVSCKNTNIIQIHKKSGVKELNNYRPTSLLSVVDKLFTKDIVN